MSKRKFLTLQERVEVIKLNDSGKSGRTIAEQLGVGKTQIHGILKRKREIMDEFECNSNMDYKRPRRATTYEDINDLCLKWFNEATGRRINVSGPLLKERALKYAKDLCVDDFKASNGWLDSFLKRNNIVFRTMSGERGDVDKQCVQDWKEKLPSICDGFEPCNIFNMDETGLFFRDSTRSTYFKKGEDCAGGKRSKERLTVALCASMTGEKVKPLVLGKSKKPRCFSGISVDSLPVLYRSNKKAWMTGSLFEEWLRWFDRRMKGRKVLLFVDNAPSHAVVQLKNVTVKYLPANTTSLCQPMDQGIIQTLKLKYRKRQLQYVLSQMELKPGKSGSDLLKEVSVLDAIYWIARSWKEVEVKTIVKCFANCGFTEKSDEIECSVQCDDESDEEEADNYPIALHVIAQSLFDCKFQELLDIDKEFRTCDSEEKDWDRPASDLLSEIREDSEQISDDDDDQCAEPSNVCSTNDCLEMIEKLKCYAKCNGHVNLLEAFVDAEDIVLDLKLVGNSKQTKISDFFSKK